MVTSTEHRCPPAPRASIDPTDAQIDDGFPPPFEASGSALGSAKKLSLDDMIAIYRAANH